VLLQYFIELVSGRKKGVEY